MRFAATLLASFDRYMHGLTSEEELTAAIVGAFTPTWRVSLGLTLGRIFEKPDAHRVPEGYAACDVDKCCRRSGYRFGDDVLDPMLAAIDRRGFFEQKAVTRYGEHQVVCKADHTLGVTLSEFKTRVAPVQWEQYVDSFQWRLMADAFEPAVVRYQVFQLAQADSGVYRFVRLHERELTPYAGLHDDCADLVQECAAYVRRRGLSHYLPNRPEPLEGPAIEDAPIRPTPDRARLRQLRQHVPARRREQDVPLPMNPVQGAVAAPIAALPPQTLQLRRSVPARQQGRLW